MERNRPRPELASNQELSFAKGLYVTPTQSGWNGGFPQLFLVHEPIANFRL